MGHSVTATNEDPTDDSFVHLLPTILRLSRSPTTINNSTRRPIRCHVSRNCRIPRRSLRMGLGLTCHRRRQIIVQTVVLCVIVALLAVIDDLTDDESDEETSS